MKSICRSAVLLSLSVSSVLAGPNANGVLAVHDASFRLSLTYGWCSLPQALCNQCGSIPTTCEAIDTELDGSNPYDPSLFRVYATFPPGSSPRLMGITWGVHYPADIVVEMWWGCGDFELNDQAWPASDTGASVTWPQPQTGLVTPVYCFFGYRYGDPAVFETRDNPDMGGWFGDDNIPAHLDPIAGYGSMGFDMPGTLLCPPPLLGACCDGDGNCTLTTEADCPGPDHVWMGAGTTCDPNPCSGIYGACCAPDCSCTVTVQSACFEGNIWMGPNTVCDPNPCDCPPPVGVCCHEDQTCTIGTQDECTGVFHQEWTTCDPNPCIVTPAERTTWGRIKVGYR